MLTMKARYAIRALTALAKHQDSRPMMTCDIARVEHIPQRFLGRIMLSLRQNEILVIRQEHGGYTLKKSADEITVDEVLTVNSGPIASEPCVSPTMRRSSDECPGFSTFGPRLVLDRVYSAALPAFESITIGELARRADTNENVVSCQTAPLHLSVAPSVIPKQGKPAIHA